MSEKIKSKTIHDKIVKVREKNPHLSIAACAEKAGVEPWGYYHYRRKTIPNKQNSKPGPKRPKYQTPQRQHPQTEQTFDDKDIHANHVEAHNAALRRKNSAFRRRCNTYAKSKIALQRTLDVHLIIHNFVRAHWGTGLVPAVALGIFAAPLCLEDILTLRFA